MTATIEKREIDEAKLNDFVGKVLGELGATMNAALVRIGDRLGLYRAMAAAGPVTSAQLAQQTGTHERYVREWLAAQAAGGFVTYDAKSQRYELPAEHALALASSDSPVQFAGAFQVALAAIRDEDKIAQAFRSGEGFGWDQHHHDLFEGTERFFRPGYNEHLVSQWIPALAGMQQRLERGARVADVGCGHGASTILMARAFPRSTFVGFDFHEPSVRWARRAAERAGVADRTTFEVARAKDFPGSNYDLVALFDCLHDMGDPVGAAAHVRQSLRPDGAWMLVEPFAHDAVEHNLNPVGRVFYCASTLICTPASLAQEVGLGLGAQAGEARLREVATRAGFRTFRRATETPFNLIFDARP
jgi:2-polyprenyl-3-methyl-5-hydroxy-6-metoxy-1,4-benzoquinol methylase